MGGILKTISPQIKMNTNINFLLLIKYLIATAILIFVILAPAWIARQTSKNKQDMILVRIASWILGWTGIGWLWALFWGTKK